jgi:uncharacterized protein with PIN domain
MAKHTGQPIEKMGRDTDRDNFLSADEAQSELRDLIDKVLTRAARLRHNFDGCVTNAVARLVTVMQQATETVPMTDKSSGEKLLYCSFCGKSQHEVRKLIAGPVGIHLR